MNIKYPLLIDGGHSTEMEKLGYDLNHKLWTAKYLTDSPEAIIKVHTAYLEAGAQCIETFSYQASIPGFVSLGYTAEEAKSFILKSVELAEKSIEVFLKNHPENEKPLIAASIGPYGAYLADGSEYRGEYDIRDKELRDFHLPRIQLLDSSNADILAFETIPSYQEANVISELLTEVSTPAWISFSCKDSKCINDGTAITECVDLFSDHDEVFAIGVNCTPPKYISGLIQEIKSRCGSKKILVYPNSGEVYNPASKTWSGITQPAILAAMTQQWLNNGVDIIGGCCRLGSQQIGEMAEALYSNNKS